ncbi:phosphoenolpyruvate carboxykinase (ATP) [Halorubrum lacusprofundi]|uniref:phosphoenolpyruvate carboxykinase (ATP) n=1 Tax=Halorubrum lacusprofundi (strain ATCC 49239 / DSM 5036 / JCM 8891 / ACAM 34) TaxID=416348 RepID=B9LRT9_HALLT|nr:phosphoenolpyruvate carboxykinase (ATP) [Halorubrum lacusprofundi]ACM57813.1 phosphoenolpyruvate carboxykinase (ATP) [Halorubrum lacusprofundi ATCC 49239]MCG1007032.1 phosphoenolpyruvate carboxykinase (ATP) [Halorubrum lacusprofundi]
MASHTVVPEPAEYPDPATTDHITYNPSFVELRELSADDEVTTEYGSPSYVSEYRSRSADATANAVDDDFGDADYDVFDRGVEWVNDPNNDVVCVDRVVGRHAETSYVCRLYLPAEYGRIALSWAKLLEPAHGQPPEFVTVQLPDATADPQIRVHPEHGVTTVLGSDYTGEAKKSFLRLFMHRAKRQGGLGLHAGSKRVTLADGDDTRDVGQLFLGLSGTGKSTLTSHGLWLDDPEGVEMIQDDVCALLPSGTVTGSEGGGLYVKTIGLDASEQPELHRAATNESAVLENVAVDDDGTVHFDEPRYGRNARATIRRDQLESSADDIDLDRVDQVFFITRNPLMPPIARLSTEQAAIAFMLGESVETSAGDPSRVGESIRVVGTNPFIVGSEGEEGNRFRDLIADLDIECYVINTGAVGTDDPIDVGVEETVAVLEGAARNRIEWGYNDDLGLTVPSSVPGIDIGQFSVADRVDDFEAARDALRDDRRDYLDRFADLDDEIRNAMY